MKNKYSLNHIKKTDKAILHYLYEAMIEQGFSKAEIVEFRMKATSDDFKHLLSLSNEMINECNERANMSKPKRR